VLAALTASGSSPDTFTFLGFPPARSKARTEWFQRLRQASGIVVFFEAPHRIRVTLEELQRAIGDQEVFIGRELTKLHESLVKCHISTFLADGTEPVGEFTVVVEIGLLPEIERASDLKDTKTRRQALSAVARDHGMTANQLYKAIEWAKKSGI
jgi:16S rRNA (cytidine1402-2'-O)-methyltransferase